MLYNLYGWEKGKVCTGRAEYTGNTGSGSNEPDEIWAIEVEYAPPEGITGNIKNVQQALDDLYIKAANYE